MNAAPTRNPLLQLISSFHPRHMPHGAPRRAYRRELIAWTLLPIMFGAVEGGIVGTIVSRTFQGVVSEAVLDTMVAVLVGAKAFSNLSSMGWAAIAMGRRKIRFIVTLQTLAALCVLIPAFVPQTPAGLFVLTAAIVGVTIFWSGVVTMRTMVWGANYPRSIRATVAGRLATIQALALAGTGLLIGWIQDVDPSAFRWIYPVATAIGLLGVWAYARVPMRQHRRLVTAEQRADEPGLRATLGQLVKPLRSDPIFARFMACLFILGAGNMMIAAPLILELRSSFELDYLGGIAAVSSVPILVMPMAIGLWSKLLNRSHVVRFRALHSWVFVMANVLLLLSVLWTNGPLLWISAVIRGVAFAGGVLAWNLGHHDFTGVESSSPYMGTHVTLAGLRGLIAPVVGVWLWQWVGPWAFALPVALAAVGGLGFMALWRAMPQP